MIQFLFYVFQCVQVFHAATAPQVGDQRQTDAITTCSALEFHCF